MFPQVAQWASALENQGEGFHFLLYCSLDVLKSLRHLCLDGEEAVTSSWEESKPIARQWHRALHVCLLSPT